MPGPISTKTYGERDERPEPMTDNIIPDPPEYLNRRSRKIFKKTAQKIVCLGIGGSMDENILAQYSSVLDMIMSLDEAAAEDSDVKLGSVNSVIKLNTLLLQLTKELGLSPLSRAKMRIQKVDDEGNLEDTL